MIVRALLLLACFGGLATTYAADSASSGDAALESELRQKTQELMDAVAPGQAEVWRRYLREDGTFLDENGELSDKAKLLAELVPLPAGLVGTIVVDRFRMTRAGDTAVVAAEIQEHLDYHGQQLHTRFRFLDTWIRTDGEWRLFARHTAAVLRDPPAVVLTTAELCAYAGTYRLTAEIATEARCDAGQLTFERTDRTPRRAVVYAAEMKDLFFAPGQPRSRRLFLRDATGAVVAFVDRREGEDIRWTRVAAASDGARKSGDR